MRIEKKSPTTNGLNIIIVGCGKVGTTLVEQLSIEGHDITVVDRDSSLVSELSNLYDVMGVVGNGASYSVLMDAGIESADLIIAVTDSDELNLLCCTVAKQVGDDCATIARVRTPDYSKEVGYLREKLGLTMVINPELEASLEMSRILCLPTALEVNSFAHGQIEMIKFKVPKDNLLDGISIATLGKEIANNVLVCAIERDGEVIIPGGDSLIFADDIITFVASRRDIRSFLKSIGFKTKQVKNTMIVGGGRSSFYLAKQLIHMGIEVKIIERNLARCEELSILLPKAIIINADGSDREVLKEEGLNLTESFVPLTGIDEENIMLTMLAKKISDAKVITKISRLEFNDVVRSLDLDSVINPKIITTETILQYVRAMANSYDSNVETLYKIMDDRVEALEFTIRRNSPITHVPFEDLHFKKNTLVAGIYRKNQLIIPDGQSYFIPGDSVIVVTTNTGFDEIGDILETRVRP